MRALGGNSGVRVMANYVVKTYDAKGRVIDRFEFAAPDDIEAQAAAWDLAGGGSRELWSGGHRLRAWRAPVSAHVDTFDLWFEPGA